MNSPFSTHQTLTCPQCGGTMDIVFVGQDRRAKCQYCRSLIDLVDLDAYQPTSENTRSSSRPVSRPVDDKLARYSLIAGIVGLFGLFPLVASLVAIMLGRKALEQIQQQPDVYTGEKTARNGVLLGWIGLGITLLTVSCGLLLNLFQFVALLIQKQ